MSAVGPAFRVRLRDGVAVALSRTDAVELELPLRHLRLAAKAWGNPADPPVLAVHGWLDNAASFDALAPLLHGRHVVAIDLAGHGRSAHRAPGNWYPYVDNLDEIGEVIAHFGWSRVDLLGHSLGATLASVFAAVSPHAVGRLLLVEGLGPIVTPSAGTLAQLQRASAARATFEADRLRVFASIDEAVVARRRSGDLGEAAARAIVTRGLHKLDGNGGFRWSTDPRLTLPSAQRFSEDQLAAVLAGIRAPSLLVLAEPEAAYLPRAVVDARAACVADIEVVRLQGSHHLHFERAEAVADVINAWLGARARGSVHGAAS